MTSDVRFVGPWAGRVRASMGSWVIPHYFEYKTAVHLAGYNFNVNGITVCWFETGVHLAGYSFNVNGITVCWFAVL